MEFVNLNEFCIYCSVQSFCTTEHGTWAKSCPTVHFLSYPVHMIKGNRTNFQNSGSNHYFKNTNHSFRVALPRSPLPQSKCFYILFTWRQKQLPKDNNFNALIR
jgi:hypothetical protein